MVRVPCCENMGLKKGPWTPEEDQILVSYIQRYGHSNWRALPKQAGLLRCGKSCRLRWINYLRPDIKRGNFTNEEEETIVKLHQVLGNRWAAIAAKLPGRTDNEIKNYWHTHLKKRLEENSGIPSSSSSADFTGKSRNESCTGKSRNAVSDSATTHQTIFPKEPSQLEFSSSAANVEAIDGFGLNTVNDTEFWYDLFMKAGNFSREVHGN